VITGRLPRTCLLHFLEIARLPGSVERGLLRTVDADVGEPASAWCSLDPSSFVTRRRAVGPKYKSAGAVAAMSFNSNIE
jgi:hypothetical protein